MSDELTPTPADQWPKDVAQTLTLPSGGVARVKAPDIFGMVRTSKMPKKVSTILVKRQTGKAITEAEALTLIEFLIAASFVSPEVTFAKEAGKLCVRDLSDADKTVVIERLGLA
jgi:hypothetical protein